MPSIQRNLHFDKAEEIRVKTYPGNLSPRSFATLEIGDPITGWSFFFESKDEIAAFAGRILDALLFDHAEKKEVA